MQQVEKDLMIQDIVGHPAFGAPKKLIIRPQEMPVGRPFMMRGLRTGVELEFEGTNITDADLVNMSRAGWSGKPDGSLREGGWEWVHTVPLIDDDLAQSIYYAMDLAARRNYLVSLRTGLHTHINVRDMTLSQYTLMLLIYALIEPAIYKYAGHDRDENVNCLPWYSAADGEFYVSNIYNYGNPARFPQTLRTEARYSGLNLSATFRFGSVEWRHMRTSLNPMDVLEWISINHRVKEASLRLNSEAFHAEIVHWFMANPRRGLEDILQEQMQLLWYPEFVNDAVKIGLRTVINIKNRARSRFGGKDDWDAAIPEMGPSESLEKFLKAHPVAQPQPKGYYEEVLERVAIDREHPRMRRQVGNEELRRLKEQADRLMLEQMRQALEPPVVANKAIPRVNPNLWANAFRRQTEDRTGNNAFVRDVGEPQPHVVVDEPGAEVEEEGDDEFDFPVVDEDDGP